MEMYMGRQSKSNRSKCFFCLDKKEGGMEMINIEKLIRSKQTKKIFTAI
jgi:hypothetical protein